MTTLFDLTYEVAVELGIVVEGIVTGGTTSTIIDTNDRVENVNYWNDGTAWLLYDAGGLGAAPEGEYKVISSWDKATYTATMRNNFSISPAAGDRYAFGKPRYPLNMIIQGVNQAIRDLPVIPFTDTTTITTASNQIEYELPIAANLDLRGVYIATNQDSNKNLWRPIHNTVIQRSDTGSADKLVFWNQPAFPYAIKLEYMAKHPPLYNSDDLLAEEINKLRVVYRAAAKVLHLWRRKTGTDEDWLLDDLKMFNDMAKEADGTFPIRRLPRVGNLTIVRDVGRYYPGDRNPR